MKHDPESVGAALSSRLRQPACWWTAATLLLLYVTLHAFALCFSARIGTLDYPIQILSADRILHGELPFRNFQVLYGPLGHYAAAAFLWPFRKLQPITAFEWYVYVAVLAFYAVVCLRLSRLRLARPVFFFGSILLLAATVDTIAPLAYYSLPMTLPLVAVVVCLPRTVPGTGSSPHAWQVLCGVLIGAEFLVRINFGVYLAVAVLLTGMAAFLFRNRPVAVAAFRCLIVALLAFCVLMAVFAAAGIAAPAMADMRVYVPRAAAGRALPWKLNANHTLVLLTGIAAASLLATALPRLRKGLIGFWLVPYLLVCAFFSYALFRFDPVHLIPLLMMALLLLFELPADAMPAEAVTFPRPVRWFGLVEVQVLLVLLLFLRIDLQLKPFYVHLPGSRRVWPHSPLVQTDMVVVRHGTEILASEASMLDRLDAMRKPEQEIFWASAPGSCQSTFDACTNLALYLADGILPRQKIWYFDTASTPFEDVQRSIVHGLDAAKTPWVGVQDVYVHQQLGIAHPESSLLQNFIQSHYVRVFTSDIPGANRKYSIYARKLDS